MARQVVSIGIVGLALVGAVLSWGATQGWFSSTPGLDDAAQAWRAVQAAPRDPERWAALADALVAIDDFAAAEQAYRTALSLGGDNPAIRGRFGFLLYSQGHDREALVELTAAHEAQVSLPMLASTIAGLRTRLAQEAAAPAARSRPAASSPTPADAVPPPASPEPDVASPPISEALAARSGSACTVPVVASRLGTFVVPVRIGEAELQLIVDTGASMTALSRRVALDVGLGIDEEHTVHAFTANGPTVFATAVVASLAVGSAELAHLRVAICDECAGPAGAGLLGLDALTGLGLQLDIQAKALRFVDCQP